MLPVSLVLRICFILILSLIVSACVPQTPITVKNGGGTGSRGSAFSAFLCPARLLNPDLYTNPAWLAEQQAQLDVYCDLEKDGTFVMLPKTPIISSYQPTWLLIDTEKMQLEVKRGEETLIVFENIAIGQSGAGLKTERGDNITPKGDYKIGWVNSDSQFHLFYGLTYPSIADAENGLQNGVISPAEHDAIVSAQQNNQVPPQNTPLGGQVGLHGLGQADASIHQAMNWTHGCVAITNEQVDALSQWITLGMRVQIK